MRFARRDSVAMPKATKTHSEQLAINRIIFVQNTRPRARYATYSRCELCSVSDRLVCVFVCALLFFFSLFIPPFCSSFSRIFSDFGFIFCSILAARWLIATDSNKCGNHRRQRWLRRWGWLERQRHIFSIFFSRSWWRWWWWCHCGSGYYSFGLIICSFWFVRCVRRTSVVFASGRTFNSRELIEWTLIRLFVVGLFLVYEECVTATAAIGIIWSWNWCEQTDARKLPTDGNWWLVANIGIQWI